MAKSPEEKNQLSRREFLVMIGGATLGTFLLPAHGAAAGPGHGPLELNLLGLPTKQDIGDGRFFLLWMEIGSDGRAESMMWTPTSPQEIEEAQRFYDAARNFNPHAPPQKEGVVGKILKSIFGTSRRSPEETKLLEAVRADLSSDAPRLAYAQWLKQKKDPLGEFIEVDCLVEAMSATDPRRAELDPKWTGLIEAHAKEWLEPIMKLGLSPTVFGYFVPGIWYTRGFVEELTIDKPGILPERAEELFEAAPLLQRLTFDYDQLDLPAIVGLQHMKLIRSLDFGRVSIDSRALKAILTSQFLVNLKSLTLWSLSLDESAARIVAESPVISRLTTLGLPGCKFTIDGARILVSTPAFAKLESLNLAVSHGLDAATLEALTSSPHLSGLRALRLDNLESGDAGLAVLAGAASLTNLANLDLEGAFGPQGVMSLVSSNVLTNLTALRLSGCQSMPPEVTKALAGWKSAQGLSSFSLWNGTFDLAAAKAFVASPTFRRLTTLKLNSCTFDPNGFRAFVGSANLRELKELDLSYTQIGEGGARALASAKLDNLKRLSLGIGDVGPKGLARLKKKFGEDVLSVYDDTEDDDDEDQDEDSDENPEVQVEETSSMTRRFEFSEGKSNKFWEISQSGTEVTVCFGRIGAAGQTQTKTFPKESAAVAHADKLIAEKTKKGYREVAAASASSAPATKAAEPAIDLAEAWKQIVETVRALDPDEARSLPGGASLDDVQSVEKEMGVSFPLAFKDSYLLHNGSNRIPVCPNAYFLPLTASEGSYGGILQAWRAMCDIGEELKDERSEPEGPIRTCHWHPKWIPFADNEGGDYVCLDFAPKKGGKIGQVIDWSHEVGAMRVLADSFGEWLVGLPEALKAFHNETRERAQGEAREERQKFAKAGCWGPAKLSGKTFCFVGNLQQWSPLDHATEHVRAEGGEVVDKVTSTLDYLVIGEVKSGRPSAQEKQATQLNNEKGANIAIVEEGEFCKLFSPTREELLAVLLSRPDPERWSWLLGGSYRAIPLPSCAGLDFRKKNFSRLDLQSVDLTGADLRDANLTGAAFNLRNGKLDGACLVDSMPRELINSSLRRADLSGSNLNTANLDGADLTEAKVRRMDSPWWRAVGAIFHAADLTQCRLEGCDLRNANFTKATLIRANVTYADLTGCDLSGANLQSADLTDAKLAGANLKNAIFRDANLACVDLTSAAIDSADFSGANLSGAKTDTLDSSKARAFPTEQKPVGRVGPNILELAAVAKQSKAIQIHAEAKLRNGKVVLDFHTGTFGTNGYQGTQGVSGYPDGGWLIPRQHESLEDCLVYLAHKFSQSTLDVKSIKVKTKGCPVDTKEAKQLVIAALREAFGE